MSLRQGWWLFASPGATAVPLASLRVTTRTWFKTLEGRRTNACSSSAQTWRPTKCSTQSSLCWRRLKTTSLTISVMWRARSKKNSTINLSATGIASSLRKAATPSPTTTAATSASTLETPWLSYSNNELVDKSWFVTTLYAIGRFGGILYLMKTSGKRTLNDNNKL